MLTYIKNILGKKAFFVGAVVILTIATFIVLGDWHLNYAINSYYHPNSVEGNYGSKFTWIFELAILSNWLYIIFVAIRGAAETKLKKLGFSTGIFLLIVLGFFTAHFIPRDYRAEYFIGKQAYSIPWQYDPRGDGLRPGGNFLGIVVSHPNLNGRYSVKHTDEQLLNISKNIFDVNGKSGITEISMDDLCPENSCKELAYGSDTYFVENGFIYRIHDQGDVLSFRDIDELNKFKILIVELFDSFKVK